MRAILKIISLNFFTLVVLFLLLEIIFRFCDNPSYSQSNKQANISVYPGQKLFIPDPLLGYNNIPGKYKIVIKDSFSFVATHNEDSHRITSNQEKDDTYSAEIWFVGCSFTYGYSINDDETFPYLIQSNLEDYKVVNWGVGGFGTIHFYLQLKKAFNEGKFPKIVVLNHAHFHEPRNTFTNERRRAVRGNRGLGPLNQPYALINKEGNLVIKNSEVLYYKPWLFAKNSALVYFFQTRFENYFDQYKKSTLVTYAILDEINALCRKNDVSLIISNISNKNVGRIISYCKENKINFVDISIDLSKEEYNNKPYDGHPSALSNKLYANQLHEYIKQHLVDL